MMFGSATRATPAMLAPAPRQRDLRAERVFCVDIARLAVGCLHTELTLHPKPGLVSLVDNGSHDDMTAAHFVRSLFALRHYFIAVCQAGIDDAPFAVLKRLATDDVVRARAKGRRMVARLTLLSSAISFSRIKPLSPI